MGSVVQINVWICKVSLGTSSLWNLPAEKENDDPEIVYDSFYSLMHSGLDFDKSASFRLFYLTFNYPMRRYTCYFHFTDE